VTPPVATPPPTSPPTSSPTGLPTGLILPETSQPTQDPCRVSTSVSCTAANGQDCNARFSQDFPTKCPIDGSLTSLELQFVSGSCTNSRNQQMMDTCQDTMAPNDPTLRLRISCADATGNTLVTTPDRIPLGSTFVVTTPTTNSALPNRVVCTLRDVANRLLQTIGISTNEELDLHDQYGAFRVTGCNTLSCRVPVTYRVSVQNVGDDPTTVTAASLNIDGVSQALDFGVTPLNAASSRVVTVPDEINQCVSSTIPVTSSVNGLPIGDDGGRCSASNSIDVRTRPVCEMDTTLTCNDCMRGEEQPQCYCPANCVREFRFVYRANNNGLPSLVTVDIRNGSTQLGSTQVFANDEIIVRNGNACLENALTMVIRDGANVLSTQSIAPNCAIQGTGIVLGTTFGNVLEFSGYSCSDTDVHNCVEDVTYEACVENDSTEPVTLESLVITSVGSVNILPSAISIDTASTVCQSGTAKFDRCGPSTVKVIADTTSPGGVPCDDETTVSFNPPVGTKFPTPSPTQAPTPAPTPFPTLPPTRTPTPAPTPFPTRAPTLPPTRAPTPFPTLPPTRAPTPGPTRAPTPGPTLPPTRAPTPFPTLPPTPAPTRGPTEPPTQFIESGEGCSVVVDINCAASNGLACTMVGPPADTRCSEIGLSSAIFQYVGGLCGGQANTNGADCVDFSTVQPSTDVRVACVNANMNTEVMTLTPNVIRLGDRFAVNAPTGSGLPLKMACTLADATGTVFQTVFLDTTFNLNLKHSFGALVLEACDDKTCLDRVDYSVAVRNNGQSSFVMDVLQVDFGTDTTSLLSQVSTTLEVGSSTRTDLSRAIDVCVAGNYLAEALARVDTQGLTTNECSSVDSAQFRVAPPCALDVTLECLGSATYEACAENEGTVGMNLFKFELALNGQVTNLLGTNTFLRPGGILCATINSPFSTCSEVSTAVATATASRSRQGACTDTATIVTNVPTLAPTGAPQVQQEAAPVCGDGTGPRPVFAPTECDDLPTNTPVAQIEQVGGGGSSGGGQQFFDVVPPEYYGKGKGGGAQRRRRPGYRA